MSKSLGNSPDPLKLFDEYGVDGDDGDDDAADPHWAALAYTVLDLHNPLRSIRLRQRHMA